MLTGPELKGRLKQNAADRVAAWQAATGGRSLAPDLSVQVEGVFACSDYVARQCQRYPDLAFELDSSDRLRDGAGGQALRDLVRAGLRAYAQADDTAQLDALRRMRHREFVRIAWRDLAGCATVEETLRDVSVVAETLIATACEWAHASIAGRHGQVCDAGGRVASLIVIAMGKLGGGELNFSSDVDLLFLYAQGGRSDGARQLDGGRYFVRVAQRLIHLLETPTEHGFVFRVDSRLRPFGTTGALAVSLGALENYLQQHGREWERYAYIKARPITGGADEQTQFADIVRPFVYRRYLDYGVIESLRDMKALIAADVARRERRDDVKLGPGGIREIEFIVQAYQLLRGGADPSLRDPSLLATLERLAGRGWMPPGQAGELADAYRFLRRVENRLQQWRDEQTHKLPRPDEDRERLAFSLGLSAWDEAARLIERQRQCVGRHFRDTVVAGEPETGADQTAGALEAIWQGGLAAGATRRELRKTGFADPDGLRQRLQAMHAGSQYRRLDQRGRERLDILVPRMLRMAAARPDPDAVIARLFDLIDAVGGRSAYFALLNENPAVLERLADLAAASPWVARRVAESPILLDELIDPRLFEVPPAREDFVADLEHRFAGVADDDLERQMEALRLFKQANELRVAIGDLSGVLPLMKVSDRLTDVAELVLDRVIALATADLRRRYGRPRIDGRVAGFAAVGYGKVGGLELGYASDLDLVFLHDSEGIDAHCDGERGLDNIRYFARLGQRILHMLNTTTVVGVLYDVDMRLRPSGKAGPLVSSVSAFRHYQQESAWTWEHQALLRARALAGDQRVMEAFEQARTAVLTARRDRDELRRQVSEMRARMRRDLPGGGLQAFDIKRDPGGLTDIEFIVQYLVLADAARNPALVRYSDNIRQLEALARARLVRGDDAERLAGIYRRYRHRVHRLALADEPGRVAPDEFTAERAWVGEQWRGLFGAEPI